MAVRKEPEGAVLEASRDLKVRRKVEEEEVEVEGDCAMEVAEDEEAQYLPGLPEHLAMECLSQAPMKAMWSVSKSWRSLLYRSAYFQAMRRGRGTGSPCSIYCMVRRRVEMEEGVRHTFGWLSFDPLAGEWSRLPAMPEDVEFQLSSPGLIGVSHSVQTQSTQDRLFVVAGLKRGAGDAMVPALSRPFIFDIRKQTWRTGSPFPVARKWCACGVAGGKLYVASGSGKEWDESLSKRAERYDPERAVWEQLDDLSTSKMSGEALSAVHLAGKLYFSSGNGIFLKVGMVLDAATGAWSVMKPGLRQGWRPITVAVKGRFYALDSVSGKVEVYDEEPDRWKLFLEDARLQRMNHVVAHSGRLCGAVSSDGSGSLLRVVDLVAEPVSFLDIAVPEGEVVALQVGDSNPNVA